MKEPLLWTLGVLMWGVATYWLMRVYFRLDAMLMILGAGCL